MRIAAQKVNNVGIGVSKSKMLDLTEKYTKQYGHCCEQLYDLAMISHKPLAPEKMTKFIDRSNKILSMMLDK